MFRSTPESTSFPENSSSPPRSRPIKSPRHIQTQSYSSRQQFDVPCGPNWVYASGGSRTVRFDFAKALDEKIAAEDETCGSSQEYYAHKAASSSSNRNHGTFVPPVQPTGNTNPRFLYPTQRPNYAFNFDRVTSADFETMNTALPFGSSPSTERKQKIRKNVEKLASLPKQTPFNFGDERSHLTPSKSVSSTRQTASAQHTSTTLTARSQNHDGNFRRNALAKSSATTTRRK